MKLKLGRNSVNLSLENVGIANRIMTGKVWTSKINKHKPKFN